MTFETARECPGRAQAAPSGLHEELYRKNSDGGQMTLEPPISNRSPKSLLPDLHIGSCVTGSDDCSPAIKNWRPAPPDSAQGRAWEQKAERQRFSPLSRDESGRYIVKEGDSLGHIAERMLREHKPHASKREIQEGIKQIIEANPSLRCNPDLLRRGQVIIIPGDRADMGTFGMVETVKPGLPTLKPKVLLPHYSNGERASDLTQQRPRTACRW